MVVTMFLEDDKKQFFFSTLSQYKVEDKHGNIIGRPGDALFFSQDMKIHSLILFGGLLEEKMEELHFRENIDPIVPVSTIQSINPDKKRIVLNVGKEELKSTDHNFKAPEGLLQFIKLKKLPIYEKHNEKVGRVVDIFFKEKGGYSLIVGGSALEDFLEKLGVIPDKDLIVPGATITEISDKIKIEVGKEDLISTLFENIDYTREFDFLNGTRAGFVSKQLNIQQYVLR